MKPETRRFSYLAVISDGMGREEIGAGEGIRTLDPNLGNFGFIGQIPLFTVLLVQIDRKHNENIVQLSALTRRVGYLPIASAASRR